MRLKYILSYCLGVIYIPSYIIAFLMFIGHGAPKGDIPPLMTILLLLSLILAIITNVIEHYAYRKWKVKDHWANVNSYSDYVEYKTMEDVE